MALRGLQARPYALQDGIATVTLHRPDKRNAFTASVRDPLIAALDHPDADDAVRALSVTGAGRAHYAGWTWLTGLGEAALQDR